MKYFMDVWQLLGRR